jgi:hypothetical protein
MTSTDVFLDGAVFPAISNEHIPQITEEPGIAALCSPLNNVLTHWPALSFYPVMQWGSVHIAQGFSENLQLCFYELMV